MLENFLVVGTHESGYRIAQLNFRIGKYFFLILLILT